MRFFSFFVLFLALALAASGTSLTITTPLYDNWGGSSSCNYGTITTCSYSNWWSNGIRQDTTWSDAGSYGGTSWVSVGQSQYYNYAWGNSWGSSFFSADGGGGWSSSDSYNQSLGSWTGQSLDTNGFGNSWGGADTQTNHTLWNSIYTWACTGAWCHQDTWWWSSNQYDYNASGWWMTMLFGEYYNSGNWENAFSTLTPDAGHYVYDWNRYGQPSGVPEPATYAMMAAGLFGLYAIRRRPCRIRTGLPSRSDKTYGD